MMNARSPERLCFAASPRGAFAKKARAFRKGLCQPAPQLDPLPAGRRRGVLTVELILTLPVFLILLVAVVQFGLYHVRIQHVGLASRIGAEQAAQTPNLQSYLVVPPGVISAITAELQSAGITQFCIRLEHNVGGPTTVLWHPSGGCPNCPNSSLSSPPYPGTSYVRVTVCVPLTELMPNVLKVFGFDLTGQTTGFTTVFRYEL